jgi:hypothetical protein
MKHHESWRALGSVWVAVTLLAAGCADGSSLTAPGSRALTGVRADVVALASPTSVTIAGSLQSELGCPGDWDPACGSTGLAYDANDDVWQRSFTIPAGAYEYKAALDGSWDVNYGAHAQLNGANIPLTLGASRTVKFYYDADTHWVTDNVSSDIAIAAGSFQSELGCSGDWQPDCLRSWLEDPDGDGVYTFTTAALPAGSYEGKVAIAESWTENYGANGLANGANVAFTVPSNGATMTFRYDGTTHVLTVLPSASVVQPTSVAVAGSLQSEAGCASDWDPSCSATQLAYDAGDGVWQRALSLPAGTYEYKAALDGSWTVNYGAHATFNGANIPLALGTARTVKFYYDQATHWITDNVTSTIVTAAGSFQSEVGCANDWDPSCLRSWLEDPDGDGVYTFSTTRLPAGSYETKAAIDESWDVNYGAGGAPNGANIAFTVAADAAPVTFTYVAATHVLTVTAGTITPPTASAQLVALRNAVVSLGLDDGVTKSLSAKLNDALVVLQGGDTATACSDLASFESQVRALRGRKLSTGVADALLAQAGSIRTTLGC